ncbi:hypothetical protein ACFP3U_18535 [Kitasatospora misakiensis]|uniref:Uncharacterized protein n=1 Tax=Kitasatospora misakiensis TaxID=67330 RepID=A0ABW0X343_9ACTN
MAGRHSRLPDPSAQRPADAEQQLRAVASGRPVPDGGDAAFLYRHESLPDGQVRTVMIRLDAAGLPFRPTAPDPAYGATERS